MFIKLRNSNIYQLQGIDLILDLILEELEVISPLLDLLGKSVLQSCDLLGVVHLEVEVDAKSSKCEFYILNCD